MDIQKGILDVAAHIAETNPVAIPKTKSNRVQFAMYLSNPPASRLRDPEILGKLCKIASKLDKTHFELNNLSPQQALRTVSMVIDFVHDTMFPPQAKK